MKQHFHEKTHPTLILDVEEKIKYFENHVTELTNYFLSKDLKEEANRNKQRYAYLKNKITKEIIRLKNSISKMRTHSFIYNR